MNAAIDDLIDPPPGTPSAPVQWLLRVIGVRRLRRAAFLAVMLAVWGDIAREGWFDPSILPGPADVASALYRGLTDGALLSALGASLRRLALGYGLATVVGLGLGVLLSAHDAIEDTVGTLVTALQALPGVCWLPLAALWFGPGDRAVVFVVVMGSLFAIQRGVWRGMRGASPAQPAILAGLTQGWASAWRSLLGAELLFYSLGLGNVLQTSRDLHDTAGVMAAMALIVGVGVAFSQGLFAPLERRLAARWGHATEGR